MRPEASVTLWIDRLKIGDPDAAQKLWERYFRRLVGLARKKLRAAPRRHALPSAAGQAKDSSCGGLRGGLRRTLIGYSAGQPGNRRPS